MSWGLQVVGIAGWGTTRHPITGEDVVGLWIAGLDPDASEGRGSAVLTPDPGRAARWDSAAEALAGWQQVHPTHPVRETDGRPNRPLTAYSVELAVLPP